MNNLKLADYYCITSDVWTDSYRHNSFLSVTVHYIVENKLLERVLAVKDFNFKQQTSANIKEMMCAVLQKYGLTSGVDKCYFVTDRGRNIVRALADFNRLDCVDHLINNILKSATNKVQLITELLENCRKLVQFFKKSGTLQQHLKTTLKSEVATRWNSAYDMIQSILDNWHEINDALENRAEIRKIGCINQHLLRSLAKILKEFKVATNDLEKSTKPTIHKVFPNYIILRELCALQFDDSDAIVDLKNNLLEQMDKLWKPRIKSLHKAAVFLFPPWNTLQPFKEKDKEEVREYIDSIYASFNQSSSFNMTPTTTASSNSRFARFEQPTPNIYTQSFNDEVNRYIAENVIFDEHFDVLEWWNHHSKIYQNLFKIFKKVMCIPASSASSERAFSMANLTFSQKRTNMGTEKLDSILVLNSNFKADGINLESFDN